MSLYDKKGCFKVVNLNCIALGDLKFIKPCGRETYYLILISTLYNLIQTDGQQSGSITNPLFLFEVRDSKKTES